jgi:hypothetical protein
LDKIFNQLNHELENKFNEDMKLSIESIKNSISPYSRFIKQENERYLKTKDDFKKIKDSIDSVKHNILHIDDNDEKNISIDKLNF